MNALRWILVLVISVFMAKTVAAGEAYYLVKVVNCDRESETLCMPASEYKTLEKNIKLEQKFFQKALTLAAKEWRADELRKGKTFLGSRLAPRIIRGSQQFPSQEKAEAQLSKMEEMDAKREERAAKKNSNQRVAKNKTADLKEAAELREASELVKAKLEELIAKSAGGADKAGAAGLDAGGIKLGVEKDKPAKDDAKADPKKK